MESPETQSRVSAKSSVNSNPIPRLRASYPCLFIKEINLRRSASASGDAYKESRLPVALKCPEASLPRDLAAIEDITARGFRDIISAILYRMPFRAIYQTGRENQEK